MKKSHSSPCLKVLVIIAHGSRLSTSNQEIATLSKALSRSIKDNTDYDIITYCFLELANPSIQQCAEKLLAEHPDQPIDLDFFPYFLSSGKHVEKDIPKAIAALEPLERIVSTNQLPYLGQHPNLLSLLIDTFSSP